MEREELERLIKALDVFTGEIFDHVSPLGRVDFLHQVQDFRCTVEERLKSC